MNVQNAHPLVFWQTVQHPAASEARAPCRSCPLKSVFWKVVHGAAAAEEAQPERRHSENKTSSGFIAVGGRKCMELPAPPPPKRPTAPSVTHYVG